MGSIACTVSDFSLQKALQVEIGIIPEKTFKNKPERERGKRERERESGEPLGNHRISLEGSSIRRLLGNLTRFPTSDP